MKNIIIILISFLMLSCSAINRSLQYNQNIDRVRDNVNELKGFYLDIRKSVAISCASGDINQEDCEDLKRVDALIIESYVLLNEERPDAIRRGLDVFFQALEAAWPLIEIYGNEDAKRSIEILSALIKSRQSRL